MIVNKDRAPHYIWGTGCDGWILSPGPQLMVIQERMPPKIKEKRHFHSQARQFFFVLSGELTMELNGESYQLTVGDGIEIPPLTRHQAQNRGAEDVHFLVVSSPTTRGDRTDVS